MHTSQYLRISIIATSLVVLAGCIIAQAPVNSNTSVENSDTTDAVVEVNATTAAEEQPVNANDTTVLADTNSDHTNSSEEIGKPVVVEDFEETIEIATEDLSDNTEKLKDSKMFAYGLHYSFLSKYEDHHSSNYETKIELNSDPFNTWAYISIFDAYLIPRTTDSRDYVDWDFFSDLEVIDPATINIKHSTYYYQDEGKINWNEFHQIKDTFTPNVLVNDIPMHIETKRGPILLDTGRFEEIKTEYYYEVYFFVQNGLNLVRINFPIDPNPYYEVAEHAPSQEDRIEALNFFTPHDAIENQKEEVINFLKSIYVDNKMEDEFTKNLLSEYEYSDEIINL